MDFKNERLMMSKEEARNRAKELFNENQVDLITKYMFLEQQCKKQKEVINKVIEIIEPITEFDMCTINGKILRKPLDILKEASE